MPKFEPIRVIISKNSPPESLKKIECEICNPILKATKEIKMFDELKSKAMEPIVNRLMNEDLLSQARANAEHIALNASTNEIERYRCDVRDATEWKKKAGGFRESSLLKEEIERLSSAPSAGELGKLKAVSGEESGIQGTINMADSNVSLEYYKKTMEKLSRATEKICPSINKSVASKGNVMGINIESKDYKYFLERVEKYGDKVGIEDYKSFYNDDEFRRIVLASAIHDGEINFHVETWRDGAFLPNTVMDYSTSGDSLYAAHEERDDKRKGIIAWYLNGSPCSDSHRHLKMNFLLFLETKHSLLGSRKNIHTKAMDKRKKNKKKKMLPSHSLTLPSPKKEKVIC